MHLTEQNCIDNESARQAGAVNAAENQSVAFPSIEGLDDRLRKAAEITKRCNDWLTRSRQTFIEGYCEGHLKIAISRVTRERGNYGVIFQARPYYDVESSSLLGSEFGDSGLSTDTNKPPMLSLNVKLMERVEDVVPSVVWFEFFDNRALISREPLYIFEPSFWMGELGETFKDRKLSVRSPTYAVSCGECLRKDIERGSRAVDDNADFGIDDERDRMTLSDLEEVASSVRIFLHESWIRAEIAPGANARFKDWKLGYGPIDAGIRW